MLAIRAHFAASTASLGDDRKASTVSDGATPAPETSHQARFGLARDGLRIALKYAENDQRQRGDCDENESSGEE
jgi:hypothetical protein